MTRTTSSSHVAPTLAIDGCTKTLVSNEGELRKAINGLPTLATGRTVVLARGPKDYIKAVQHGDLWAVTTRSGSFFSLGSFIAQMITDYSERNTRESRAAGSLWGRMKRWAGSPYPERALSTAQVETLFV